MDYDVGGEFKLALTSDTLVIRENRTVTIDFSLQRSALCNEVINTKSSAYPIIVTHQFARALNISLIMRSHRSGDITPSYSFNSSLDIAIVNYRYYYFRS